MLDKRAMYGEFKASLPANERDDRFFKIFYSDVRPSTLMIIGLNPGGDPRKPSSLQSNSTFYDGDEHDYVDCGYPLAIKMRRLLLETGAASNADAIRGIPKTNVIFHRSARWTDLANPANACALARVHVEAILKAVKPRLLLVEGFEAFTQLVTQQSLTVTKPTTLVRARLKTATLTFADSREVKAIVLGHPTGARWSSDEWQTAIETVRVECDSGSRTGRGDSSTDGPQRERPSTTSTASARSLQPWKLTSINKRTPSISHRRTWLLAAMLAALSLYGYATWHRASVAGDAAEAERVNRWSETPPTNASLLGAQAGSTNAALAGSAEVKPRPLDIAPARTPHDVDNVADPYGTRTR